MPYLLALSLLLAPLYIWRFSIAGVPLNFLMLWLVFVWLVFALWLLQKRLAGEFLSQIKKIDRALLILIGLFFLAGCISLFAGGGITRAKTGQFIVLFVQPLSLFFIADFLARKFPQARHYFRSAAYLFVAVCGAVSLAQYFTLATLPPDWWGNSVEPKRAIGLFSHPDMYGLFLAPLLAWLLPDVLRRLDAAWRNKLNLVIIAAWLLGSAGLLLSLSRGAWFGFAAAGLVGIIIYGSRKYWAVGAIAAVCVALVIIAVPNLRYRLIVPFVGEKSSQARFSLWQTGEKMVKDNPVLGKGLDGFDANWYQYNTDPSLDHYNFPHNIVLNFWVDMGILGVISFLGLLVYGWWHGLWRYKSSTYALGLGLFLVALAVHGIIDTPYLKNDLALVFWLIWGISRYPSYQ